MLEQFTGKKQTALGIVQEISNIRNRMQFPYILQFTLYSNKANILKKEERKGAMKDKKLPWNTNVKN